MKRKGFAPLITVVAIGILFGMFFFMGGFFIPGEIGPGGFTTLALSRADFVSNSDFFNEETWILYVSQGGLGQRANAQSSSGTNSENIAQSSGTQPNNDFTIDMFYKEQSCEYSIKQDTSAFKIQKLNVYKEWEFCFSVPSGMPDECSAVASRIVYWGKYPGSFKCYCIEETSASPVGYLETPQIHTQVDITVGNEQSTQTFNFDTREEIAGYIGSDVYVRWDGYKGTAQGCASTNPYRATYYNGKWRIISDNNYELYRSRRLNFDGLMGGPGVSESYLDTQLSFVNNQADLAVQNVAFGSLRNEFSMSNAVLKNVIEPPIEIPTFVFYVKAEWLGIEQPIGEPEIGDIIAPKFAAGQEGIVTVPVKNIGTEREGFNVWIECPSPPFTVGPTQTNVVYPDVIFPFRISVSGDTANIIISTCTAYAESLDFKKSKTFQITLDPQSVCQANVWVCEENVAKRCNSAGSALEIKDVCQEDEECAYRSNGETYCKEKESTCVQDGEASQLLKPCCAGLVERNGICSGEGADWLGIIIAAFIVALVIVILLLILGYVGAFIPVIGPALAKLQVLGQPNIFAGVLILLMIIFLVLFGADAVMSGASFITATIGI